MLWARIQRITLAVLVVTMLCMQSSSATFVYADDEAASNKNAKSDDKDEKKTKKLVPVFTLTRPVLESPVGDDPLFGSVGAETLKSLVARLEKAKDDDEVAAVVVTLGGASMGRVVSGSDAGSAAGAGRRMQTIVTAPPTSAAAPRPMRIEPTSTGAIIPLRVPIVKRSGSPVHPPPPMTAEPTR